MVRDRRFKDRIKFVAFPTYLVTVDRHCASRSSLWCQSLAQGLPILQINSLLIQGWSEAFLQVQNRPQRQSPSGRPDQPLRLALANWPSHARRTSISPKLARCMAIPAQTFPAALLSIAPIRGWWSRMVSLDEPCQKSEPKRVCDPPLA